MVQKEKEEGVGRYFSVFRIRGYKIDYFWPYIPNYTLLVDFLNSQITFFSLMRRKQGLRTLKFSIWFFNTFVSVYITYIIKLRKVW